MPFLCPLFINKHKINSSEVAIMQKLIFEYVGTFDNKSVIVIRNEKATAILPLEEKASHININGYEYRILGISKKLSISDHIQYFLLLDTDNFIPNTSEIEF